MWLPKLRWSKFFCHLNPTLQSQIFPVSNTFHIFLEPNLTIQESSIPFQKCLKHLAKANNQAPLAAAVTPLHHMTHPTRAKI
jgi:hypothetical protein